MRMGIRASLLATLLSVVGGCGTEEPGSTNNGEVGGVVADAADVIDTIDDGGGTSGTGISLGSISGFGSIIVNGTAFDTTNATITVNGRTTAHTDLYAGMVARIEGNLQTAVAERVDAADALRGPIDSLIVTGASNAEATLSVLGQTVQTNAITHFLNTDLNALQVGDIVAISGFRDASSRIIASAVAPRPESAEFTVSGTIAQTSAHAFSLGALRVDFSNADLSKLPADIPLEGQTVNVRALSADLSESPLRLNASEVELAHRLDAAPGDLVEVEALVLEATDAPASFRIAGFAVATTTATVFSGGAATDIQTDRRVEIEGRVDRRGVLQAETVVVRPIDYPVRIRAAVESIDSPAKILSMLNVSVQTDALTRFIDLNEHNAGGFGLDNINPGDIVDMRGFSNDTGIVAAAIKREAFDMRTVLQGPVENEDEAAGTVTQSGVTITGTESDTRFQDKNAQPLSQDEFHSAVEIGDVVRAEWNPFSSTDIAADKLEILESVPQSPLDSEEDEEDDRQADISPVTINASAARDSWLKQAAPDENFGGENELSIKNKPDDSERAVYLFDLDTLPDGALVNTAILKLRVTSTDIAPVNVYRITDDWSEGGVTWDSTANDIDSSTIHGSFRPDEDDAFVTADIASLAQQWVCGTTNYGLMLMATSADVQSRYHSKEEGQSGFRPSLEVTFVPGAGSCP